jgi:outer membrane protein insertion porin family
MRICQDSLSSTRSQSIITFDMPLSDLSQRMLALCAALILGIGAVAFAQEGFRVDYIHFNGNETFSDGELRKQTTLRGYNWIQEKILRKTSSEFSSDVLAHDLERLRLFYQRRGFLDVDLARRDLRISSTAQSVGIEIDIREGPPVIVDSVIWRIDAPSADDSIEVAKVLGSRMPPIQLREGARFRDRFVLADADSTDRFFARHGFPYARSVPTLNVDTTSNTVALTWIVTSGPQCVYGSISVTGNRRITESIIIRQLTFEPGQVFRQSELDASQRQLTELGSFEVVTVTGELSRGHDKTIPVRITVREAPVLSSKVGAGYGREDNVRVFNESRLLGAIGGARRLELYAKHSGLEPFHVRLRLTQPAFITPRTSATLSPYLRRQKEPGFDLTRWGISAGLNQPLGDRVIISSEYSFERIDLDTASVASVDLPHSGLATLYNKSAVDVAAIYDNSRPAFYPDHGNFVILAGKMSGLGLGSQYHFLRLLFDVRHYEGIRGVVLATRLKVGGIRSFDDDRFVPVEDRFFSGGSSSIRGWARGELGPQSDGVPIGGSSLIEASMELRIPIWGILSGATFTDMGNVWQRAFHYDLSDIRYSAGVGLRVATPIGPVRLDVARPIFDDDVSYEFHVNVGQAF